MRALEHFFFVPVPVGSRIWTNPPMQEVLATIDGFAHGGEGVGTIHEGQSERSGKRIFVAGALPGEEVQALLTHEKKRYAKGRLEQVLQASPDRVTPACAVADRCGGCNWQHVAPARQAPYKAEIAASQLRAFVGQIDAVYASPKLLGYRRRARLHVRKRGGDVEIGFYVAGTNEVLDLQQCPVLVPELEQVLPWLSQLAPLLIDKTQIHLLAAQGKVLIGVSGVCPRKEQKSELSALLEQAPDPVCGIEFRGKRARMTVGYKTLVLGDGLGREDKTPLRCGAFDFAQAQDDQNKKLLEVVSKHARGVRGEILELYCGAGNLTRVLAQDGRRVEAWDDARASIDALRRRVTQDETMKVFVNQGTALKALKKANEKQRKYELLVVDPPRTGLGAAVVKGILQLEIKEMVYVACDLATLQRDLRLLVDGGYRCMHTSMIDMMPMTSEVEMVVRLSRGA